MKSTWMRLLALAALVASSGCEEEFSPLSPTALQYSVFGYLDASADTQWLRVMPLRQNLLTTPDASAASVTLEDVASGRVIALRDSVFRFNDAGSVSEGVYLHNYWTTERIDPGASYRLLVREPGREPAEAVVQVPQRYTTEVWLRQSTAPSSVLDLLHVSGAGHLPFSSVTTSAYDDCGWFLDTKPLARAASTERTHTIALQKAAVPRRSGACGAPRADGRILWLVGSEEAWPEGKQYSPTNIGAWNHVSNVTNSIGFMGGVLTRRVPYESCDLLGPAPLPHHCKLRYDESTATIYGLVLESRCGRGPFDTLQVQLTQVTPDATGYRKQRTTLTNRAGQYRVSGLEPGVRYFLRARAPTRPGFAGPDSLYHDFTDTVQFTPGEVRERTLGMWRLDDCSVPYR